jgi:hypothetical protein
MGVKVVSVKEQNTIGANGQITKAVVLTYMVGTQGPFTLVTNQTDLQSGAAALAMTNFANTLALLPGLQA